MVRYICQSGRAPLTLRGWYHAARALCGTCVRARLLRASGSCGAV